MLQICPGDVHQLNWQFVVFIVRLKHKSLYSSTQLKRILFQFLHALQTDRRIASQATRRQCFWMPVARPFHEKLEIIF